MNDIVPVGTLYLKDGDGDGRFDWGNEYDQAFDQNLLPLTASQAMANLESHFQCDVSEGFYFKIPNQDSTRQSVALGFVPPAFGFTNTPTTTRQPVLRHPIALLVGAAVVLGVWQPWKTDDQPDGEIHHDGFVIFASGDEVEPAPEEVDDADLDEDDDDITEGDEDPGVLLDQAAHKSSRGFNDVAAVLFLRAALSFARSGDFDQAFEAYRNARELIDDFYDDATYSTSNRMFIPFHEDLAPLLREFSLLCIDFHDEDPARQEILQLIKELVPLAWRESVYLSAYYRNFFERSFSGEESGFSLWRRLISNRLGWDLDADSQLEAIESDVSEGDRLRALEWIAIAHRFAEASDYDSAIHCGEEALQIYSRGSSESAETEALLFLLGQWAQNLGEHEEAVKHFIVVADGAFQDGRFAFVDTEVAPLFRQSYEELSREERIAFLTDLMRRGQSIVTTFLDDAEALASQGRSDDAREVYDRIEDLLIRMQRWHGDRLALVENHDSNIGTWNNQMSQWFHDNFSIRGPIAQLFTEALADIEEERAELRNP